jgi:hypothetical protein
VFTNLLNHGPHASLIFLAVWTQSATGRERFTSDLSPRIRKVAPSLRYG